MTIPYSWPFHYRVIWWWHLTISALASTFESIWSNEIIWSSVTTRRLVTWTIPADKRLSVRFAPSGTRVCRLHPTELNAKWTVIWTSASGCSKNETCLCVPGHNYAFHVAFFCYFFFILQYLSAGVPRWKELNRSARPNRKPRLLALMADSF